MRKILCYAFCQSWLLFQLVGNSDRNERKVRTLNPWITARFILINPRSWKGRISLRVEFYGCRDGKRKHRNRNRPFAARDHMVQNTPNWSANECARLRDKTQLTSKM